MAVFAFTLLLSVLYIHQTVGELLPLCPAETCALMKLGISGPLEEKFVCRKTSDIRCPDRFKERSLTQIVTSKHGGDDLDEDPGAEVYTQTKEWKAFKSDARTAYEMESGDTFCVGRACYEPVGIWPAGLLMPCSRHAMPISLQYATPDTTSARGFSAGRKVPAFACSIPRDGKCKEGFKAFPSYIPEGPHKQSGYLGHTRNGELVAVTLGDRVCVLQPLPQCLPLPCSPDDRVCVGYTTKCVALFALQKRVVGGRSTIETDQEQESLSDVCMSRHETTCPDGFSQLEQFQEETAPLTEGFRAYVLPERRIFYHAAAAFKFCVQRPTGEGGCRAKYKELVEDGKKISPGLAYGVTVAEEFPPIPPMRRAASGGRGLSPEDRLAQRLAAEHVWHGSPSAGIDELTAMEKENRAITARIAREKAGLSRTEQRQKRLAVITADLAALEKKAGTGGEEKKASSFVGYNDYNYNWNLVILSIVPFMICFICSCMGMGFVCGGIFGYFAVSLKQPKIEFNESNQV